MSRRAGIDYIVGVAFIQLTRGTIAGEILAVHMHHLMFI